MHEFGCGSFIDVRVGHGLGIQLDFARLFVIYPAELMERLLTIGEIVDCHTVGFVLLQSAKHQKRGLARESARLTRT